MRSIVLNVVMLISIIVTTSNAQVISDNKYHYGFNDIFGWNCTILQNKEVEGQDVRMVFYKDIHSFNKDVIFCSLKRITEKGYTATVNQMMRNKRYVLTAKIKNSYGRQASVVFKEKNEYIKKAYIDHSGYLLTVIFFYDQADSNRRFETFISTYVNIVANFTI